MTPLRWLPALLCCMPGLALLIQQFVQILGDGDPWRTPLWLAAVCPLLALPAFLQRQVGSVALDNPSEAPSMGTDDKVVVLAAGLAHELGQPLSVARVGIEGLHMLRQMGREPSAEYVDKTMRDVGRSVLAMTAIIEHLRDLALRSREADLQQVDLVRFVDEMVAERALWLRDHEVQIAWEQPDPVPNLALVDGKGLRLILVNLLKNASEAVTRLPPAQRQVRLRSLGRGCLVVHNRGPAIPPERQAGIFDPFVSGKRSEEGPRLQGIGLYLANMTAERMGATLGLHSSEEEGTSFTLACRRPGGC